MFKVGDKIVCIKNMTDSQFGDKSYCLTVHKTYIVIKNKSAFTVSILNDQGLQQPFNIKRFISQVDFRKQKLEKICSKLAI